MILLWCTLGLHEFKKYYTIKFGRVSFLSLTIIRVLDGRPTHIINKKIENNMFHVISYRCNAIHFGWCDIFFTRVVLIVSSEKR